MPLLSAISKILALGILSEMYVSVTVTKVWNFKGDKKCPDETLDDDLSICRP